MTTLTKLDQSGLTPIRRKMLRILSDGGIHSRQELHGCLEDELAQLASIKHHIELLRKFLRPKGLLIVCVLPGGDKGTIPHYQMVRHLTSPND